MDKLLFSSRLGTAKHAVWMSHARRPGLFAQVNFLAFFCPVPMSGKRVWTRNELLASCMGSTLVAILLTDQVIRVSGGQTLVKYFHPVSSGIVKNTLNSVHAQMYSSM